jgi:4-amino-4-deoxy-L-arabinose transferase-like glycosyltransferase
MSSVSSQKQPVALRRGSGWLIGLSLLVLIGFWLRLSTLLGSVYQVDEFTSMLAANMVAERGLPILPSGLFYDHGLLFSFASGALIWLVGFREEIARWPALLASVLTIAIYYDVARRLFNSRLTGLLTATLVTCDSLSIVWGQRARMYAFAHLFVLLSIAWSLEGTLQRPSERSRYLALAFLIAALFSHTVVFLIVPTLAILLLVFSLAYRRDWLYHPHLWRQVIVVLIALAFVLGVVSMGQTGSTVPLQDPNAQSPPPLGLEFLRGFFQPGLEWSRFSSFVEFVDGYNWLLAAAGLALLGVSYRCLRHKASAADVAFLFLVLFLVFSVVVPGILLSESWLLSRYLFILIFPAFLLLGAESLSRLLRWLAALASKLPALGLNASPSRQAWLASAMPVLGVMLVVAIKGPGAWETPYSQGTGDSYNTAFTTVREHWQPGDKMITVHPAASYLYLRQCDYYANQATAHVLPDSEDEGAPLDRYTGSPLIDSVEKLNAVLAGGPRVWFVVDEGRLFGRYTLLFTQQVLAQMDLAYRTGNVCVFVSRPHPVPLAAEPQAALDADFGHVIRLEGYSLDTTAVASDRVVWLGLYWRPVGNFPRIKAKVFVQLRDGQGQIIAQADHFIYQGLLGSHMWDTMRQQKEWLRDAAELQLSRSLPAGGGPYRLYVGLYDPSALNRVPLLNDTSGENAIVIELPALQ